MLIMMLIMMEMMMCRLAVCPVYTHTHIPAAAALNISTLSLPQLAASELGFPDLDAHAADG